MEGLELVCFQMISSAGAARSSFIEAIDKARSGDIDGAKASLQEGEEAFVDGHKAHSQLISKEAAGEGEVPTLLLVHAEDQMMAAETFQILADEFINLYEDKYKTKQADAAAGKDA